MNRVLATLLLLCGFAVARAQQNVVILIADDLGTDYCGFYEDAVDTANMPNIRALVDRGVRFANAWAAPTCSPTRAGILTGRHSFRTGVGMALSGADYPDLDTSEYAIPKLLRAPAPISYLSACVGKWHVNQRTPQKLNYPATFGYDLYAGNFLGELPDYFNWNKVTNGVSTTSTNYATTETIDDAIGWLGELPAEQPFFLWVAFNAPHTPLHAPPAALHTVPGLTGTQNHIRQNPKLYFKAMIEAMDTEAGRLLAWLRDHGRLDSTNVIFIGDNGNIGRVSQIADTTHTKGTVYEYGLHVPFAVAGPAVATPGRTSAALVSTVDLFATILELCGHTAWRDSIPASVPVDSRSIVPILGDKESSVRAWTFSEQFKPTPDASDGKAIRNAEYKLIRFDLGGEEFYNLASDRNEAANLLALGRPLSATEQSNYESLCTAMNTLLGREACSSTVSAPYAPASGGSDAVAVYPNPSASGYRITGLGADREVTYRLVAIDGSIVQAGALAVRNGGALLDASVATGRYILMLRLGDGRDVGVMIDVRR
jgi:arylsulfatase A-like enzyme